MYYYDKKYDMRSIKHNQRVISDYEYDVIFKINRRAHAPGIYFLFNENKCVYIGKSKNMYKRVKTHFDKGKIIFDSYVMLRTLEREMADLETYYINKYMPEFNQVVFFNGKGAAAFA